MNTTNNILEGIGEAMRFLRDNWISERSPVWEGDVHDFMANVIDERVSLFDVMRVLTSISNGDHVPELVGVYVRKDRTGKIQRILVREDLTTQERNP